MLPSLPKLLKLHFEEEKLIWFSCSTQIVMMPLEIHKKKSFSELF